MSNDTDFRHNGDQTDQGACVEEIPAFIRHRHAGLIDLSNFETIFRFDSIQHQIPFCKLFSMERMGDFRA